MTKLLITGATGFIGRNLAESFSRQYEVSAPTSAVLDLCDERAVHDYLKAGRFDVVIHAAGTRSNRRLGAPSDMLDRNCRMFFNLARNERLFGKMLYFGSGAEYSRHCVPAMVKESYFDTHVPVDPYGFSKYICAKYAERAEKIYNLRLFGVFGKYEAWDVRFISNACCRVVHGLPIVIRQDLYFDYLYIDDLTNLTRWFIESKPRRKSYNVCRGTRFQLTELAAIVAEVSGRHPEIVVRAPGVGPEYSGDNSLLLEEVGPYKFGKMNDSIRKLYLWYEEHKNEIDPQQLRFDG